jgi:DNA-binding MarR family transcriptional regulator
MANCTASPKQRHLAPANMSDTVADNTFTHIENSAPDSLVLLRRAAVIGMRIDDALRGSELNVDRWRALEFIQSSPGCSMAELIDALVISPTTATRVVVTLVEVGAVFRAPAPHDRRRVTLQLSAHGAALLREAQPAILRIWLKSGLSRG